MFKKTISFMIVLALLVSAIPTAAFAAEADTSDTNIAEEMVSPGENTISVTDIPLDQTQLELEAQEETANLAAAVEPESAADDTVKEEGPDLKAESVENETVVTQTNGNATIPTTTNDDSVAETCETTVTDTGETNSVTIQEAVEISLDKNELVLTVGEIGELAATVTPEDAADKTIIWETSNSDVATVENGVVTAAAVGTATITAKSADGKLSACCEVTVADAGESDPVAIKDVAAISLDKSELVLTVGETGELAATVTPEDATDKTIIWETSNSGVATVENGVVTPVAMGVATITAKSSDGSVSDSCTVTVWGTCGESAKWFVEDTTLFIEGSGAISDSANAMKQPWKAKRTQITAIELGSDITYIGKFAFAMFSKLTALTIPEDSSLETIGLNSFMGTSRLTSVTLPGSLVKISDSTIANKEIHFRGTASQWEALGYTGKKDVYVLDETGGEIKYEANPYSGKYGENVTWNLVPETGTLTISGTGAMQDSISADAVPWYRHRDMITNVDINEGVTSVGAFAFAEYSNLTTVTLPATVTKIGTYAFRTDTSLTGIDLRNVADFGDDAFVNCSGLTSLKLDSAQNIGKEAFVNCSGLTAVTLGNGEHRVERIGKRAFNGCTKLETVDFTNVKEVGEYSFEGSNLTGADLSSVEVIGQFAFNKSAKLQNITFGDKLTTIEQSAFANTGLTTVTVPGTVTNIANYVFSGCTQMTDAAIGEGITTVPSGCFSGNTAMKTVSLPASLTTVGQYAFDRCGLETVDYAGTAEQWKTVSVAENNEPLIALMGKHVISVTGVSLNKNEMQLTFGGATETLKATITPEKADNKKVTWKSDNEAVVSVDETGKVTPKGVGRATVTVTTEDGNFEAQCVVTVVDPDPEIDLSAFTFTVENAGKRIELHPEKQTDGSYRLIAPTYVIGNFRESASITIKAPESLEKSFSVTFETWNQESGDKLGEKTEQSSNGTAAIAGYYNPWGKADSTRYEEGYGFIYLLEYSDFVIQTEESDRTYRVCLSLYNDLQSIVIKNKSDTAVADPMITQTGENRYSVKLNRGDTYAIDAIGGLQTNSYTKSISYITRNGEPEGEAGSILYTPGEETEADFVIRITNTDTAYQIADRTYNLHVTVEEAAQKRLSFEKYVYTLNGKKYEATADNGYVIPQITQYDQLEIEAIVTNADDTATFVWKRGLGRNQTVIEGATSSIVTIDTSSPKLMDYWGITGTVTSGGQVIKLPSLKVQKLNVLKLAAPEIITQPVGGQYSVGEEALVFALLKNPGQGLIKCQWYRCDDEKGTNAEPISGATDCTVTEAGQKTTYTVPSTETGTGWYYCEMYLYYTAQNLSGPKIKTDCVKVEIVDAGLPLEGEGTAEKPYLITSEADLEAIRNEVANGNAFVGINFAFANDVTLSSSWTPIGCTKDGSGNIQSGNNLNVFSGTIDGCGKTLTVAAGGLPLLGYVKGAAVKNLNIFGERIAGYGLVNNFEGVGLEGSAIVIDHVRLLSGTQTLKSGLIGANVTTNGFAGVSAGFVATIRNCTVEEGVVIGYTGAEDHIGSIAGRFQGTIENCVSYATVKGKDYVGGIIGGRDNALGTCAVAQSAFHGTVEGSGSYVGGIAGVTYSGAAAPNGNRVAIMGCSVDGTVKGSQCVGGILGGDPKVAQAWNGYSITGNTFTGSVSGNQYVGGIIGYYESLNKMDNIVGNSYCAECGADKGIGYVHYLDTSCDHPTLMEDTVLLNTGKTTENCPNVGSKWRANHNRTDDPLGKDADKLAKKIGGSEMPICYKLEAAGTYKKEFTVGEDLDLTGIELTAYWNNNTTTKVALSDVTVTGYDKNKAGEQTVSLTYGAAKLDILITVKPKSTMITVTVTILGDSKHGSTGGIHGLAMGGLTTWVSESNIEADTSETVWDVLQRVFEKNGLSVRTGNNQYNTVYISAVNGLSEFDNGKYSGWMYTVNGTHPEVGVSAKYLKQGDVIVLHYTDDYTKEKGGMTPSDDHTAKNVDTLISQIGTVTLTDSCKKHIDAARKAYDALSKAEKAKVTQLAVLEKAEAEYAKLKKADDQKKANDVIALIKRIGNKVTLNSEQAIKKARSAYNKLTAEQRNLVTNYKALRDAENALARLKATEADKKKAQTVIDMIDKLGNITLDSEEDIKAARTAYDKLTDLQKALVENDQVLEKAEEALLALKERQAYENAYKTTGDYLENLGTPEVGSIGGEWMVIGLARSDRKVSESYYDNVVKYVTENINADERLHSSKSTDNSRLILALTAIGNDVTDVDGHNLLLGLNDMDYIQKQGVNGPVWALIALDSGNYPVPDGGDVTREGLIQVILDAQLADGGWALSGDDSNPDMTGMALQALAPYYRTDAKVQSAVDKALVMLSNIQNEDGSYSTIVSGRKVPTSESISQVVVALTALGINPDTDERFIKNGHSAMEALLKHYVSGGGFNHILDGQLDGMATEQAYYALTAYYRFLSGKTSLYDMTDVIDMGRDSVDVPVETTEPVTVQVEENGSPWWILTVALVIAYGAGVLTVVVILPRIRKKGSAK